MKHGFEGNMQVYGWKLSESLPVYQWHIARKYMFYLIYYTEYMD